MINLERIKNAKGITYSVKEFPEINGEYVKRLRKKLGMSQSLFACLLHVTKKTVEKWEQGVNPVSNGNAVAMVLFDENPTLVNYFIETRGEIYDSYRDAEIVSQDWNANITYNYTPKTAAASWRLKTATARQ